MVTGAEGQTQIPQTPFKPAQPPPHSASSVNASFAAPSVPVKTVVEETRTRTKTEMPGHVEEPVKIDANASLDAGQFKFKDLRNELKNKARQKRKIS